MLFTLIQIAPPTEGTAVSLWANPPTKVAISPKTGELFFEHHDVNNGSFDTLIVTTLPSLVFLASSSFFLRFPWPTGVLDGGVWTSGGCSGELGLKA
jgi:hypothetical protein